MQKIILVNGPPSSGKDTLANYIKHSWGAEHIKFAAPMYNAIPQLFNLSPRDLGNPLRGSQRSPAESAGKSLAPRSHDLAVRASDETAFRLQHLRQTVGKFAPALRKRVVRGQRFGIQARGPGSAGRPRPRPYTAVETTASRMRLFTRFTVVYQPGLRDT